MSWEDGNIPQNIVSRTRNRSACWSVCVVSSFCRGDSNRLARQIIVGVNHASNNCHPSEEICPCSGNCREWKWVPYRTWSIALILADKRGITKKDLYTGWSKLVCVRAVWFFSDSFENLHKQATYNDNISQGKDIRSHFYHKITHQKSANLARIAQKKKYLPTSFQSLSYFTIPS